MKKQLLAFLFLILAAVFYFSCAGVLVGLYLLITEPSLINAILVGLCTIVVIVFAIIMKLKPGFRALVIGFLENNPM